MDQGSSFFSAESPFRCLTTILNTYRRIGIKIVAKTDAFSMLIANGVPMTANTRVEI